MQVRFWFVAFLVGALAVPVQGQKPGSNLAGKPTCGGGKGGRDKPSLEDTEKWITNTLRENTRNSVCEEFDSRKPGSEYGREFRCNHESYFLKFDGCKVTFFTLHSHRNETLNGDSYEMSLDEGDDKKDDSVVEFNLSDIDPKSIQAQPPHGAFGPLDKKTFHDNWQLIDICLATTNSADTIQEKFPYSSHSKEHQPYRIHKLCGFMDNFVTVRTPEYAPRFVKALTRAVELCGGKPSAF